MVHYFFGFIVTLAIIALIGFLIICVDAGNQKTYETRTAINERLAAFNAEPIEFRKKVAQFFSSVDEETYLVELYELDEKSPIEMSSTHLIVYLIIMSIICPLCFLANYWTDCRGCSYFLADLPWAKPKYFVLLLYMFGIPWLFLLGSFIRMKRYDHRQAEERRTALVRQVPDNESSSETTGRIVGYETIDRHINDNESQKYVDFYVNWSAELFQSQIDDLADKINNIKDSIREYGRCIQNKQTEINYLNAQMRSMRERLPTIHEEIRSKDRSEFQREWAEICEMRGIVTFKIKPKTGLVKAEIDVRVPYRGKIYDFGDFEVKFTVGDDYAFSCTEIRQAFIQSNNAVYRIGGEFCFGQRRSEIMDHISNGRICAALAIIVDCMHAVNPEHRSLIPKAYPIASKR